VREERRDLMLRSLDEQTAPPDGEDPTKNSACSFVLIYLMKLEGTVGRSGAQDLDCDLKNRKFEGGHVRNSALFGSSADRLRRKKTRGQGWGLGSDQRGSSSAWEIRPAHAGISGSVGWPPKDKG
jgi:hypothetical protein